MPSHYDEAYYRSTLDMSDAMFVMASKLRAQKLQPSIGPSDRVLEFGVGSGLNLASLVCGARHGYDINPISNVVARKNGIELVEPSKIERETYDVVICHHVLEHLMAPVECLMEAHRLLRHGGTLLLFVPYEEQPRYRKHMSNDPDHHLYSWTPHTLANLVIECGFKLRSASVGTFGYDRICARWAVKFGLGEAGYRFIHQGAHLIRPEREVRVVAERP
jgi:SAM-dependent methyltransferase